jgi:hypothetical protein
MEKLKTVNCPIPNQAINTTNGFIKCFEIHIDKRGNAHQTKILICPRQGIFCHGWKP